MNGSLPGKPDSNFVILADTVSRIAGSETVYLVGGAVRDLLLAQPSHDLDFALEGNVRRLARRVADDLHGDFFMLDEERSTARVIYYPPPAGRMFLDFALMRGATIEDDLRGRDFTINAMALDLHNPGELIDPLEGRADLEARQLRLASPTSLEDDPVRVLRAVRQSLALDFPLEPAMLSTLQRAVHGLKNSSVERQRDELFKILEGSRVSTAIRILDEIGALGLLLPELELMKGVAQTAPHVYDVWEHTLALVEALESLLDALNGSKAANSMVEIAVSELERYLPQLKAHLNAALNPNRALCGLLFLAGLYHDVAKPAARAPGPDGRIHFIGHEEAGAETVTRRAWELVLSQSEVQRVEAIVAGHMRIHLLAQAGPDLSRRSTYRYFKRTGAAGVDICLLSLADTLATYGPTLPLDFWKDELAICRQLLAAWWENPSESVAPPRLLTGDDLIAKLNLTPGPQIGELLAAIQEAQACGEISNRQQALNYAVKYLKKRKEK